MVSLASPVHGLQLYPIVVLLLCGWEFPSSISSAGWVARAPFPGQTQQSHSQFAAGALEELPWGVSEIGGCPLEFPCFQGGSLLEGVSWGFPGGEWKRAGGTWPPAPSRGAALPRDSGQGFWGGRVTNWSFSAVSEMHQRMFERSLFEGLPDVA